MEETVKNLEAMFWESKADLDVIEKHLQLDLINHRAEKGFPHEVHCMAQSVQQLKQLLVNNVGETTPESTYGVSPLPLIQKGDPLNGHTQRKGQPPCWKSSASNLFNKPTSGNFESYGGI
ncbi:spindle and kinetochore-associated protein 2 isoform X4 [Syngnathus scovelli]|uniref:spindle and kinetochore-associated protein 2 isoform X4 n=1 Tax=Syngnathus scovelli TaxID=161590 RepID=UPI0035C94B0C